MLLLSAPNRRNLSTMGDMFNPPTVQVPAAAIKKPRVVVLGTGWGGNKVAREINKDIYDVRVISPSNHFLFTSFLPSTAVGTLEFRAIQEPIRTCKGLGEYYQAKAERVDTKAQEVHCKDIFKNQPFKVSYDYLVIAAGCKTNVSK